MASRGVAVADISHDTFRSWFSLDESDVKVYNILLLLPVPLRP